MHALLDVAEAPPAGCARTIVPDWVPPSPMLRRAVTQVFPSLVEAHAFIETRLLHTESAD